MRNQGPALAEDVMTQNKEGLLSQHPGGLGLAVRAELAMLLLRAVCYQQDLRVSPSPQQGCRRQPSTDPPWLAPSGPLPNMPGTCSCPRACRAQKGETVRRGPPLHVPVLHEPLPSELRPQRNENGVLLPQAPGSPFDTDRTNAPARGTRVIFLGCGQELAG